MNKMQDVKAFPHWSSHSYPPEQGQTDIHSQQLSKRAETLHN